MKYYRYKVNGFKLSGSTNEYCIITKTTTNYVACFLKSICIIYLNLKYLILENFQLGGPMNILIFTNITMSEKIMIEKLFERSQYG